MTAPFGDAYDRAGIETARSITPEALDLPRAIVNALATLDEVLKRLDEIERPEEIALAFTGILRILEAVPAVDRPRMLEAAACFFGLEAGDTEPPEPPL